MLEPFAYDLWTVARPLRFWGVECGTRMTVVRLSDGGVLIHCPVALDDETRRAVDAVGPVRAVVAASLFHHLYVGEWRKAYPDALVAACPGLDRKRADLRFDVVLGDVPHPLWANDLEQVYFSARFEHEVVFFHRRSRTMICADALLNLSTIPVALTRAVARLMGSTGPGKGWVERVAVRNHALGRAQVDRMLRWDIDRITLAHGDPIRANGREVLQAAYAWL